MKTSVVKNSFFIDIVFYRMLFLFAVYCCLGSYQCVAFVFKIFKIFVTVPSEDVCWSIRNVKLINF